MGSLSRKLARNKAKKYKKDIKKQLMLFDKLGDECCACTKPFDKKSKEHVTTWNVVVREQEQVVRLYCPTCWDAAIKMIKDMEDQSDN